MLNKILSTLQSVGNQLKDGAKRFFNQANLDRAAAVVAIIAFCPDGKADKKEIEQGISSITKLVGRGVFSEAEMKAKVQTFIIDLMSDEDATVTDILCKTLANVAKQDAVYLLNIGLAVAKSSGGEDGVDPTSDDEKKWLSKLAKNMNLDPADYGLPA